MPIHVLRPDVAAKIAAGEVIERPSSAVKELVENSLDADARRIQIEVGGGGLELIRVLDDGRGIPPDEIELAFHRFATSKVSDIADLEAIQTLGFRGEALASIAAVSSVTLASRVSGEDAATEIELIEGAVVGRKLRGADLGTSVTARGLFENFPARRKFLASPSSEASRVRAMVQRYALAYPDVAWSLSVDGRVSISTSGSGSLVDAVAEVYGAEVAGAMIEVDAALEGTAVRGLAAAPHLSRSSRSHITVFVNGRWVLPGRLGHALEQAYHGFLGERRFPLVVLNVRLDPGEVDVNVHPAKVEVRFRRPRDVYGAVQRAVREALLRDTPVPPMQPAERAIGATAAPVAPSGAMWTSGLARSGAPSDHAASAAAAGVPEIAPSPSDVLPALRVLGQSQTTYIVAEGPDGIYLIDQHAAHERVLYESVMSGEGEAASQALLEPAQVNLDDLAPDLREALDSAAEVLAAGGFVLEPFGPSLYLLRAVPAAMGVEDPVGGLLEVLRAVSGAGQVDRREYAARSIACHGAVRAGKRLARQEMEELTRLLERCSQPHTCPHGRPTMIHLSRSHLEREFGRT